MSPMEFRAGASLAAIFGVRMLGLFLILPVFAVHAHTLSGGENLTLVGLALGAYGLVQAFLQLPYGLASDRWGRKPLIIIGLVIFAAGSFLAAAATSIWLAIAGRALQGAGAISSVVVALAADLTREEHRTKSMAMIGVTIGLSFALSLVVAPILYRYIGMAGIFSLTGALSLAAIWVVKALVPDALVRPERAQGHIGRGIREGMLHPELWRLNFGIFVLHMVQMAMFVVVPPLLVNAGLALGDHWKLYLPVVLASFVLIVPPIMYTDRGNRSKPVLVGAIVMLVGVQAGLGALDPSLPLLAFLMLLFFASFNVLEASIPSLVSRIAPARARGAAIGVYNTAQTLGLFCGGLGGGWLANNFGTAAVFVSCAVLAAAWLVAALGMRPLPRVEVNSLASLTFHIAAGVDIEHLRSELALVRGVHEAEVVEGERLARLKVVPGQWDEVSVKKLVTGGT